MQQLSINNNQHQDAEPLGKMSKVGVWVHSQKHLLNDDFQTQFHGFVVKDNRYGRGSADGSVELVIVEVSEEHCRKGCRFRAYPYLEKGVHRKDSVIIPYSTSYTLSIEDCKECNTINLDEEID